MQFNTYSYYENVTDFMCNKNILFLDGCLFIVSLSQWSTRLQFDQLFHGSYLIKVKNLKYCTTEVRKTNAYLLNTSVEAR